jgi:hypothetical protein
LDVFGDSAHSSTRIVHGQPKLRRTSRTNHSPRAGRDSSLAERAVEGRTEARIRILGSRLSSTFGTDEMKVCSRGGS